MAFEVVMPRLGWNMEEGALAGWRKKDGEPVSAGEILFEVESDKAIQEVEALEGGILRIPPDSPPPGTVVPVGTLLAYLLKPGESLPTGGARAPAAIAPAPQPRKHPPPAPASPTAASAPAPAAPPPGPAARAGRRAISPRAKRVAGELGVEWTSIAGSGRTGRIVERDVRLALSAHRVAPAAVGHPTAVPVTLTTEADATELVRLHAYFGTSGAPVTPTYNDLLIRIAALALQEHPQINARATGGVNIGFTIATDRGLLVAVIRDAPAQSLLAIARETARLAERARAGSLGVEERSGGTFTVTNLGSLGIDSFTPPLRAGERAILGAGRITAKQVVTDSGAVAIRRMVTLSLTFDHRLVDAGIAARFLQSVRRAIEQPYLWVAGG